MSVFTSMVVATLDQIPGAPSQTVTIRKLAPKHLRAAAFEAQRQSIQDFRALGGAETMRELRSISDDQIKTAVDADPLVKYDRAVLIQHGVVEWSFLDSADEALAKTRDVIDDLDDDAQEYLARAILRLAKPSLFLDETEVEAEEKNA